MSMPPTPTTQSGKQELLRDALGEIKTRLEGIRDSGGTAEFEGTENARNLSNALRNTQVTNGVISARSAEQAVKNAEDAMSTLRRGTGNNPITQLQNQNAQLQEQIENEKKARESLEADLSIANKRSGDTVITSGSDETQTEPTAQPSAAQPTADSVSALSVDSDDPIVQAQVLFAQETVANVNSQLDALNAIVEAEDADMQRSVKNIRDLAQSQIARAQRENERLTRAARVAGIVSGRGQYSPLEHEGIVSEVIQEGLARVEEIEYKAQEAELEARKAQREFRYKAFVEASDIVQELSEMKRQTIIDIGERLRQVEQDQREKQRFDNEMADRNAFILAPELVDATPEEIARAAYANGIEPGQLAREVEAYKQEQEMFDLDRRQAEEAILSSQQSRRIAQARFDRENQTKVEPEKALTADELKKFADEYGLREGDVNLIPTYWTRSDLDGFINKYPNAPAEDVPRLIQQYEDIVVASAITDDTEREQYLASVVEPTDVVVADVTNRVKNEAKQFFAQAKEEGDASIWRNKRNDVNVWVSKPATQEKIADLANSGMTAYQVYEELKRLYARGE